MKARRDTMDREYNYHNEIKNEYIKTMKNEDVQYGALSKLKQIDEFETKIQKNILDWSTDDFDKFFKDLKYTSLIALNSYRNAIVRYVEFLESSLALSSEKSTMVSTLYCKNKLIPFVNEKKLENTLITCSDYEKIIKNTFCEEKLVLIEQIFFFMFWHNTVNSSDEIFNYNMSNIDLVEGTIRQKDGKLDKISCEEIDLIKKFKESQQTPVEVLRVRKKTSDICGTIEINDSLLLYTDLNSENLIHPIYGSKYIGIKNGQEVEENKLKQTPLIMKFGRGSGRVNEITQQIENKTGIDFKPKAIERCRIYCDLIKNKKINTSNLAGSVFKEYDNWYSYSVNELQIILEKIKNQEN